MSQIRVIISEKESKESNSIINIVVNDNKVSVSAIDVEYKDMLKALEGLSFATTKAGINCAETPVEIYNVIKDIAEVMVNGRDNAFEEFN